MKLITLTQGYFAKIDDEDFERVSNIKWAFAKQAKGTGGYAIAHIPNSGRNGNHMKMHHFVLNIVGKGIRIDHKNLDKLDNRKKNLREASKRLNTANVPKLKQKFITSSKFKGVSVYNDRKSKLRAYIVNNQ